jgi:hypothetical protein
MKIRRWLPTVSLSLTILLLFPIQAWACACCSGEGEYRISFRKLTTHELELMREMRFGPLANTITTPADDSSGMADRYSLTATLSGNLWKLALRDGNKLGTLNLPLPAKMLSYVVDTHDGQKSPGGGPVLYKEWRYEGRASATGFLRSAAPTTYFLVLQGRGNRCDNAEDFSHWRLEVKGPKARYAFYGELVRSSAATSDH